jgi:hypothetical protein
MMAGRAMRQAVPEEVRAAVKHVPVPAPTRGWVTNENLAAAQPGGALVLDNFFPTRKTLDMRGGTVKYATIGGTALTRVETLMTYSAGTTNKMFAANANMIYDVSAVLDPDADASAVVIGLSSGQFSWVPFSTSGGNFLVAVNGTDHEKLYDGATWSTITATSSPVAITGVATSALSAVWAYRERLFYIEKNTLTAWYLPVTAIGGAALDISLAGIFINGGSLLFGATWSLDAGDGIDDKCVFVSDRGEVAIFEGSNPSDANDWRLVGRYEFGRPLGKRAFIRAGGELMVATEVGLVPISAAIQRDKAALGLAAVSNAIEPDWLADVALRGTGQWEVIKWTKRGMGVVGLPVDSPVTPAYCYVVNLESGAWCKFTGWDVQCLAVFNNILYFGTSTGTVMQAEASGADDGAAYVCRCAWGFDHFGAPGQTKTVNMARMTFQASQAFAPQISVSTNYNIAFPTAPASVADADTYDVWDNALWDTAIWDARNPAAVTSKWVSIGRTGFSFAAQVQITSDTIAVPDAKLVAIDLMHEAGAVVV